MLITCSYCQTQLQVSPGTRILRCSCCRRAITALPNPQVTERQTQSQAITSPYGNSYSGDQESYDQHKPTYISCSKCKKPLQYQPGAKILRCSICRTFAPLPCESNFRKADESRVPSSAASILPYSEVKAEESEADANGGNSNISQPGQAGREEPKSELTGGKYAVFLKSPRVIQKTNEGGDDDRVTGIVRATKTTKVWSTANNGMQNLNGIINNPGVVDGTGNNCIYFKNCQIALYATQQEYQSKAIDILEGQATGLSI